MISIMFTQELNWAFVANSTVTTEQIFAYFPDCLYSALNITEEQVMQYALEVNKPSSYTGPEDADDLRTVWLGYIPSDLVDELASEIKARTSAFYTGVSGIPQTLASFVDASFALDSVSSTSTTSSGDSSSSSSSSSGSSSNARIDAIIGVCSALGGIAVLVIGFSLYRSLRRRQELAHRRLQEPDMSEVYGTRRVDGQNFDQDSIGGQRRRSFYFAEDSLRGLGSDAGTVAAGSQDPQLMRRNVMPTAIGTPHLTQSSMHWEGR